MSSIFFQPRQCSFEPVAGRVGIIHGEDTVIDLFLRHWNNKPPNLEAVMDGFTFLYLL